MTDRNKRAKSKGLNEINEAIYSMQFEKKSEVDIRIRDGNGNGCSVYVPLNAGV